MCGKGMIWECPSCEDNFLGSTPREAYEHLLKCGKPDPGYRGWVYKGVEGQYQSELEALGDKMG